MARRNLETAAPWVPERVTIKQLGVAAAGCQACPLWKTGTQTVFGAGPDHAKVMLIGEQPGDEEDETGEPFVGPAGRLLNEALAEAGINRDATYVTNVVKHFKWEARGKRRLHKKPNASEIAACRPWLEGELKAIKPEVIVLLGATAAQALLGRAFRVSQQRGEFLPSSLAPRVMATFHPAAILRSPDDEARRMAKQQFVRDLKKVAEFI